MCKYAPGELRAVAYGASGRPQGESGLHSAVGTPVISAKPEVFSVASGGYIPVPLIGANGVIESNADRRLTVVVENGELLAFGSANPCTEEQYHTGSFTTYCGLALAIVHTPPPVL